MASQRALPGVQVTAVTQAPARQRWPLGQGASTKPSPRMLHARSAPVAPQVVAPGVHAAIAQRPSIPQRRPAPQSPSRRHSTQAPRAVSHCCPTAQSIAPRQVVRVTQALARHI